MLIIVNTNLWPSLHNEVITYTIKIMVLDINGDEHGEIDLDTLTVQYAYLADDPLV